VTEAVLLPQPDGSLQRYQPRAPRKWPRPEGGLRCRVALAAPHVIADPLAENVPGGPAVLDWDATLAFRRYLWSYGFGIAEAMDTAQRGMGMDWATSRELITRSAREASLAGGRLAAGAGTDHLPDDPGGLDAVISGYEDQIGAIEETGAQTVIMSSRHLARAARHAEDYREVYRRLLTQVSRPVILHWLGLAFDPALTGYWGSADLDQAAQTLLGIVKDHASVVDGVKLSLLDRELELRVRAALPPGVRLYTGDDFNYAELIRGGSDALLGAFSAIAPAAAGALQALDRGDTGGYDELISPTIPLARHIFAAPTPFYKTGIAFLAWLAGHQRGFAMVAGLQTARSVPHLARVYTLADQAGLLPDPELAAGRMRAFLQVAGVGS
jgi:hypothetical protein